MRSHEAKLFPFSESSLRSAATRPAHPAVFFPVVRGHYPPLCGHAVGGLAGGRRPRAGEGKAESYSEAVRALRTHRSGP